MHALFLSMMLSAQRSATVDTIVIRAMRDYQIPSAAVAIVEHGKIAYLRGYNATPQTQFSIGSVTKEIVAAEIMHLAEKREVRLDDRVRTYEPQAPPTLTIRELLDQRSGIPDYNTLPVIVRLLPSFVAGELTPEVIGATVLRQPLAFAPGSRFQYSNSNYLLLGLVIERITGQQITSVLNKDVFEAARMERTSLEDVRFCSPGIACGSTKLPWGIGYVPPWNATLRFTAGGITSTASDLAHLDVSLLNDPRYASWRAAQFARPPNGGYEYGAYEYRSGGKRIIWHDGTVPGFKAMNSLVLDDRDAVVVLTNADYAHAQIVAMQLEQALFAIPGGGGEGVDPNLPAISYTIAFLCVLLPLIAALAMRTLPPVAAAFAACAYVGAIYVWYAGVLLGALAIASVILSGAQRSRRIVTSD